MSIVPEYFHTDTTHPLSPDVVRLMHEKFKGGMKDSSGERLLIHNVKLDQRGTGLISRGLCLYYSTAYGKKPALLCLMLTRIDLSGYDQSITEKDNAEIFPFSKNAVDRDVLVLVEGACRPTAIHFFNREEELVRDGWANAHAETVQADEDSASAFKRIMKERRSKIGRRRPNEYKPEAAILVFGDDDPEAVVLELLNQKMIAANLAQSLMGRLAPMSGHMTSENLMRYDAFAAAHGLEQRKIGVAASGYPFPLRPARPPEGERPNLRNCATGSSRSPR